MKLHDAKTLVSRDVHQAVAGDEDVIAQTGKPLVRRAPMEPQRSPSAAGASSGGRL
jgi:antitoxin (DNA-binding transcriptional repressor) of toxin-antitoxin stability system